MAATDADPRVAPPGGGGAAPESVTSNTDNNSGGGPGPGTLTGMAVVQKAFHFLDGPADVLSAATACHRWRELACADSVWRARFRREKMLEKARLFEVALPPVRGRDGQGGAADSAATAATATVAAAAALVKDEAAGVGLAFYAQIFTLKVLRLLVLRSVRAAFLRTYLTSASRTRHPPPLCRGTR